MKKFLPFFLFLLPFYTNVYGQSLHVDSTRFITGLSHGTTIKYSIATADKGILFLGIENGNPGGIIPSFLLDTVNDNVLIGKIDSNQQINWIKVYGGTNDDVPGYACQTADGGYAVFAQTMSSDGNVTGDRGGGDLWLLRTDANGNLLWEKTYGSSQSDAPIAIANTPDHGFIMLGQTNGSDGDVPFHYGSAFSFDWVVIKTDSMGNKQWSKDLGGTGEEFSNGSVLAINSSYYLIGSSNSIDHDCTDTAWHPGVSVGSVIYVLKLDTNGNVLWDSSYGDSTGAGVADALFDVRDSTIVMMGEAGANGYMVTGYHSCTDEGDYWVVKVDTNGTLLWAKTLGSIQEETSTSVCVAPDGGYMAYGQTFPQECYDSTIGDIGGQDCWLFLLDSAGNEIANKVFGGIDPEAPASVIPYLNGFAATGVSGSSAFTEGTTYGNFDNLGGAFVSYISFWPLSVNSMQLAANSMQIYPNPSQDKINVILNGNNNGSLVVMNTLGQVVYREEIRSKKSITVNVSEYPAGVYCVVWHGADGYRSVQKIIVA